MNLSKANYLIEHYSTCIYLLLFSQKHAIEALYSLQLILLFKFMNTSKFLIFYYYVFSL